MTDKASATASANDARVETSSAPLEDMQAKARQKAYDEEPERILAAAERSLEKAKLSVTHAEAAVTQAKKDVDAMRKERAATAEKENG